MAGLAHHIPQAGAFLVLRLLLVASRQDVGWRRANAGERFGHECVSERIQCLIKLAQHLLHVMRIPSHPLDASPVLFILLHTHTLSLHHTGLLMAQYKLLQGHLRQIMATQHNTPLASAPASVSGSANAAAVSARPLKKGGRRRSASGSDAASASTHMSASGVSGSDDGVSASTGRASSGSHSSGLDEGGSSSIDAQTSPVPTAVASAANTLAAPDTPSRRSGTRVTKKPGSSSGSSSKKSRRVGGMEGEGPKSVRRSAPDEEEPPVLQQQIQEELNRKSRGRKRAMSQ